MVEVITNAGRSEHTLDNTGETDVAAALQQLFDAIARVDGVGATVTFPPGIYRIDTPLIVRVPSIRLQGHSHSAIDIHGMNLAGGSILRFGPDCGPNCITFDYAGHSRAFPSGESPWSQQTVRVELDALTFMGHNNTDVDTAQGYSRFRGDEPNFRGLRWYPAPGRYGDVEGEGQRAVVIPRGKQGQKPEQLRVTRCSFTDLYVGLDVAASATAQVVGRFHAPPPGRYTDPTPPDKPAIVLNQYGAGRCLYLAGTFGEMANTYAPPEHRRLMVNAVNAFSRPLVELTGGLGNVEMTVRRQDRRLIVHLVNYAGLPPRPFERVAPQQDLVLRVTTDAAPKAAQLLAAGTGCEVERDGNAAVIRIPQLDEYEVIVLEL